MRNLGQPVVAWSGIAQELLDRAAVTRRKRGAEKRLKGESQRDQAGEPETEATKLSGQAPQTRRACYKELYGIN
jgi:hypothetical protein